LARGINCDRNDAGGMLWIDAHVTGGQAQGGHIVEDLVAALVLADCADERYFVPEFAQVGREIEGGTPQIFLVFDNVP
jgi:hypothetical protein